MSVRGDVKFKNLLWESDGEYRRIMETFWINEIEFTVGKMSVLNIQSSKMVHPGRRKVRIREKILLHIFLILENYYRKSSWKGTTCNKFPRTSYTNEWVNGGEKRND